jgi:hypothetical protein
LSVAEVSGDLSAVARDFVEALVPEAFMVAEVVSMAEEEAVSTAVAAVAAVADTVS